MTFRKHDGAGEFRTQQVNKKT